MQYISISGKLAFSFILVLILSSLNLVLASPETKPALYRRNSYMEHALVQFESKAENQALINEIKTASAEKNHDHLKILTKINELFQKFWNKHDHIQELKDLCGTLVADSQSRVTAPKVRRYCIAFDNAWKGFMSAPTTL